MSSFWMTTSPEQLTTIPSFIVSPGQARLHKGYSPDKSALVSRFSQRRPRLLNPTSVRVGKRAIPYASAGPAPSSNRPPVQSPSATTFKPPADSFFLSRIASNLWSFSRPHTIYGTILSITSLSSLALLAGSPIPIASAAISYLTALIPGLLINVYVVGLNQIYDVSIDRINKPSLPLAAGTMTENDAKLVVAFSLIAGLAFCFAPAATTPLRTVLVGSTILGTAYSMPPFRMKRFPLLASAAILSVRGFLININFFKHAALATAAVAGGSTGALVSFTTAFFVVFGLIIALMKDVPDIRGDQAFGIRTFSVRMGSQAVFRMCVRMLYSIFGIAALYHYTLSKSVVGVIGAAVHVLVAFGLRWFGKRVNAESSDEVYKYYMLSWKAFYLEYLLLPLTLL